MKLLDKSEQILTAALTLFVEQGFHGTPTSQIAQVAGVSNGTLFHYYPTKDDLVLALYNHIKDELQTYLQEQLRAVSLIQERLKITFIQSVRWALENPQKFYYVQQFHFSPHLAKVPAEVIQRQNQLHLDLIQQAIDQHLVRPLPVGLLFTLISSQVFGLYQYLTKIPHSPEEQIKTITEGFALLWQMVKA